MSDEIKPCPFCEGDPAPLDENNHTSCTNIACGSTAYMHVDAWNNRPAMKAYARIEELEAELGGWIPIETAPKDGTSVSLWAILQGQDVGQWWPEATWDGEGWRVDDGYGGGRLVRAWNITHWMPLPTPPTGAA